MYSLAKQVNLKQQVGIMSEMRSFFEYKEEIKNANLKYGGYTYKIEIELNQFNISSAKLLFTEFVRFIEYSNATFYVLESSNNLTQFYMLTWAEDNSGIFSKIIMY
jgi:hypothetical protein